jgi:hypothetical protein
MKLTNKDVKPRAEIKLNKKIKVDGGAMTFGDKDDYPNVIEKVVSSSITGVTVANMNARFLTGLGFENEAINDQVIGVDNRGKERTIIDLLRLCAESVSYFNGLYIHCPMNLKGDIKDPTLISFKNCRFSKVDDKGYTNSIVVNPLFGQSGFKAGESIPYPVFNPREEVIEAQVKKAKGIEKYSGQMYFQFWDNRFLYPLSPFDPVYLDNDTEWQLSLYKNRELRNGFMLRHILRVAQFESDTDRENFLKMLNDTEGGDGARVLLLEDEYDQETGSLKESGAFSLDKVDTNINDKLFESWEQSLSNKIRKANKGMPAILIDYENGKLGTTSGEAITQAVNFYNAMTVDDRALMSKVFKDIFSRSDNKVLRENTNWRIKPLKLIDEIQEVEQ